MSRDTKIREKLSVSAAFRLSLSPCGERFGEGEVPSLGKEGRVVVKKVGLVSGSSPLMLIEHDEQRI